MFGYKIKTHFGMRRNCRQSIRQCDGFGVNLWVPSPPEFLGHLQDRQVGLQDLSILKLGFMDVLICFDRSIMIPIVTHRPRGLPGLQH